MFEICQQEKCKFSKFIFYLGHIHHFFIPQIKCVIQGAVRWGNVSSGKFHAGNCPSGKLSIRGTVRRGNIFGKLSVGEMFVGEFYTKICHLSTTSHYRCYHHCNIQ